VTNCLFQKSERIVRKKLIDELFTGGQSLSLVAFPLRVVYMTKPLDGEKPKDSLPQTLMSVSKRRFKHAVDRNRAKRQIREAYRLNKTLLLPTSEAEEKRRLFVAFIWLADKPVSSRRVTAAMKELLHKLNVRCRVDH
jgi:ribonuclease P protein component